jgi:hypothetical protein
MGVIGRSQEGDATERLSNLRLAQGEDPTLKSLLGILTIKLDLCSRLLVCEWGAAHAGDASSAATFKRLAEEERRTSSYLTDCLRRHLEHRAATTGGSPS